MNPLMAYRRSSFIFALLLFLQLPTSFAASAVSPSYDDTIPFKKVVSTPSVSAEKTSSSQNDRVEQSIREQVVALRQQRLQQMPYLDKGYIKEKISSENVKKREFFSLEGRKDLQELINRALDVHTPTLTAEERISLAKRRILVAFRNLLPEVDFEWERRTGQYSGRPFNNMNYQMSLRQPLFRGGILWNTMLQEKKGLEAAKKEYEVVLSDLIKDVSKAYFEFNQTVQVERDQRLMLTRMERFSEISQKKFAEGIISEIEHLNVQSLYSQLQYDYETAKQEIEIAKLEIQRFLDVDFESELYINPLYDVERFLTDDVNDQNADLLFFEEREKGGEDINIPSLSELVDMAYQNRPELRVESSKLDSARLEERIKWGELIPRADLVMEFGKTGEAFNDVASRPSFQQDFRVQLEMNWNAMGSSIGHTFEHDEQAPTVAQFQGGAGSDFSSNRINAGLFDGLDALVETKEAEVAKLEQIEELEQAEREIVLDVKQSYYDFQKARIQTRSSVQRLNYRKRLSGLAEFRLQQNEIEISEYLQSELDYLNELSALHEALGDYFIAKANLNHAIGLKDYFNIEEDHA